MGSASSASRFASTHDFWEPAERDRLAQLPARRLVDQLDELLTESVRSQLLADAPVGVLCSGGVDSSVVVAMAARVHSNVSVFHANVVGRHSESEAAAAVAQHLKLDLQVRGGSRRRLHRDVAYAHGALCPPVHASSRLGPILFACHSSLGSMASRESFPEKQPMSASWATSR